MTVTCVLKSKIRFLGLENCEYTLIQIKGKGITVRSLDRKEYKEQISNLQLAEPSEYADYNPSLGVVYTDGRFKSYLEKRPQLKEMLYKIVEKLDE